MKKTFKIFILVVLINLTKLPNAFSNEEKINIGLLVPMSGDNKNIGELIIKSTRMALEDINKNNIEIYPKDTSNNPEKTLQAAKELKDLGVKIIIGPVFFKNLIYLNEVENVIFLSLTNKTLDLPKNIISTGVNSISQLRAIKKFLIENDLKNTIFLTPKLDYELEVKEAIKNSKIKYKDYYSYDTEPTKLTKQIEKITNYKIRQQNLEDEISRIEKSDLVNKEQRIEKLKKKYTIGKVNFDSVIISDFGESLKSVITSLLYTDVSPKDKYIITFNQWFDESLIKENNIQPIYYPSINNENLINFKEKFEKKYNLTPNHLTLLSYDLVGLIYYLSIKNNISELDKLFKKKNTFKGKIGIFEIENNKINHKLNFYKIDNKEIKKIF